ncbi:MAG: hypothetical protein KatS3mg105_4125 [Gemmatales bacterium]|nr:MAG: hypothetical protein KatS3mg105_4125 [Gemmatales bacterium]
MPWQQYLHFHLESEAQVVMLHACVESWQTAQFAERPFGE